MRIRYYRSHGYIEDDANDDDTESKTGDITEQYSEESTEGGVEIDLEAKNDDDVEQHREACNENVEESIEDGGEGDLEAKNVEQEEIKEQTPTGRLGNVVASYTTIHRNLHVEKFPLPYVKSSWNFDEDDKPALCLFETTDGRGFVKKLEEIPRQTFVIEVLGELIDAETKETLGDTKYIFEILAGDKDECPAIVYQEVHLSFDETPARLQYQYDVTLPKPSSNNGVTGPTLSPYERMRQLLVSRTEEARVIDTVDVDLKIHLTGADKHKPVRIRMRLIWVSEHMHNPWKFARLHFVDASAQESLEEMLQVFREPYKAKSQEVDSLLQTATV
ncbi:hypothetical protein PPTG_00461 [Phytophthora nicotianae INRA-310]|uniref:Uncharacterized protein n=1 Tax=Phytophthora nicotianae (strain INRA-310) TaxID=761204 RepID=W2RH63_PHYN3|nr:hypothetical protein PPTG_00461 [Phytophthora nicotianae INRA-310]ETN23994.1 hypothetical protein PPTG_00461 [Phytophthora nicotianae INRA-310]